MASTIPSYRPDPAADWHLLVGDESALPAITAALADLPDNAVVRVVLLVDSPDHHASLTLPAGGEVIWLHRSAGEERGLLLGAVRDLAWPEGRVHAFVHGKSSGRSAKAVMQ